MSAWDDLLDHLDHVAAGRHDTSASQLTTMLRAAQREGLADGELDPVDAGRWLERLVAARDDLDAGDDTALSTLRVVVTRWLHPPRLDLAARAAETFGD